ncbi:MAG: hypothetical protein JWN85_4642 [Gammaproteobacteria bacterium]|nr:hypothetical protein [Gammaproteobacteria bacterium]
MIKLLAASLIVDNALAYARSHKFAPLTVAVLDARGCTVMLKAEDGCSLLRPEIAQGKAWGALGMGFGTRALASRAEKLPAFFNALAALSGGRIVPVPGGVLILSSERELLGACGASGDHADNDEACVIAGIESAGLLAEPGK